MVLDGLIRGARDARWLTRGRIVAGGQILFLVELTALVMLALFQHGVTSGEVSKTSSDFVSFYAAGKLALAGTPALAYDQATHFLTEQRFMVEGAPYQYFFYPPVFLLLCAPLALLPYTVAFYAFEIATLAAFLLTMRQILREPDWAWAGPVLAFPAIFWTFGLGQNAFLTATLFGGFTLLLGRRPVSAGVLLGCLCYKPHFGLLAPVALALGGHWKAFFAAGAAVAGLVLLSAALFGGETWHAYLAAFFDSNAVYGTGRIDYAGIITPFGAARLAGIGASPAYLVQACLAVAMALLVGAVWRSGASRPLRMAALLSATLLAVPVALLYDRMLLLVAIGWLVREARRNGFLPWEKIALLTVWLVTIGEYAITSLAPLPLAPAITLALLLLTVRRVAWVGTKARPTAAEVSAPAAVSREPRAARYRSAAPVSQG